MKYKYCGDDKYLKGNWVDNGIIGSYTIGNFGYMIFHLLKKGKKEILIGSNELQQYIGLWKNNERN